MSEMKFQNTIEGRLIIIGNQVSQLDMHELVQDVDLLPRSVSIMSFGMKELKNLY